MPTPTQQLLGTIDGIISLYSIILILNIFWLYHSKKSNGKIIGEKDYGLVWLAVAFFSWTLTGLIHMNFPGQEPIVSFLSMGNNGIFICSFAFFDHGIEFLTKRIQRRNYFITTAIVTAILICTNLFLIGVGLGAYADYIEAVFTTLTLSGFAGILFHSFFSRKLYGIAFISLSVVCLVVFSQLSNLLNLNGNQIVKSAIEVASRSLLLTIVISLAFSWIIEKIEEKYDTDSNFKGRKLVDEFSGNNEGLQNALRDKISNDEVELALLALKEFYKEKIDKKNLNTVIIRSCNFNQVQLQIRNGTIGKDVANRELAEISKSILELIDKIE